VYATAIKGPEQQNIRLYPFYSSICLITILKNVCKVVKLVAIKVRYDVALLLVLNSVLTRAFHYILTQVPVVNTAANNKTMSVLSLTQRKLLSMLLDRLVVKVTICLRPAGSGFANSQYIA
jgi:HJR/Mrr/RecB family endonuclease